MISSGIVFKNILLLFLGKFTEIILELSSCY